MHLPVLKVSWLPCFQTVQEAFLVYIFFVQSIGLFCSCIISDAPVRSMDLDVG